MKSGSGYSQRDAEILSVNSLLEGFRGEKGKGRSLSDGSN